MMFLMKIQKQQSLIKCLIINNLPINNIQKYVFMICTGREFTAHQSVSAHAHTF